MIRCEAVRLAATIALAAVTCAAPALGEERELEEVVVTATRTALASDQAPQAVRVLEKEEIDAAGGGIEAALDRLPAVRVNRTGAPYMAALPTIRGSQPGEVLVMVDGHRLNSQQSGWFSLSDLPLPPWFVDRIEVLEDASSALYGAEAMGGVVNIITRDPSQMPAAAGRATWGTLGRWDGGLSFRAAAAGAGLGVSFDRAVNDGFRSNTDLEQERLAARATLPGDTWAVDLWAGRLSKELGSPGPEAYPTPDARQRDDTTSWGLSTGWYPGEGVEISAEAYLNRYLREYEDPGYGQRSRHLSHTRGGGLGVLVEGAGGRWNGGVEAARDELESTNDGTHHLTRLGLYLQDEWRPREGVTLFLAGRWDGYSLFDDEFSPRAALVLSRTDGAFVRASAARGYRTPTFDDLFWDGPFARGNPELEPERAWSYGLAAGVKRPGGPGVTLDLFLRDVENLIDWRDADGDWVYMPENLSSARITGGTVALKAPLWPDSSLDLSYTALHPEDRDRGEVIPGRPRHLAKADLRFRSSRLDAAAGLSWTDRWPGAGLEDESYWEALLHVGKTFDLSPGSLSLSLDVSNLLDGDHQVVPGYPVPGRELSLTAQWSF